MLGIRKKTTRVNLMIGKSMMNNGKINQKNDIGN